MESEITRQESSKDRKKGNYEKHEDSRLKIDKGYCYCWQRMMQEEEESDEQTNEDAADPDYVEVLILTSLSYLMHLTDKKDCDGQSLWEEQKEADRDVNERKMNAKRLLEQHEFLS